VVPETASRVRGRIETVVNFAKVHDLYSHDNPATWALLAPALATKERPHEHFAAMDYRQLPAFTKRLRAQDTMAARALEFLILTAARSTEARCALWSEIDLSAKIWSIPATRMKAHEEHKVPLSARAVEILEELAFVRSGEFVFAGWRHSKPLSCNSLAATLRLIEGKDVTNRATVHGFRSSFRDWCGEETSFERELAEQALAHTIGNAVERSYRRGTLLEKRRGLMTAWAQFLAAEAPCNVIAIGAGRPL
jgi:integrase